MHRLKNFILPLILGIFIASCEKDDDTVIDPVLHFPTITSNYITPSVINSDSVNCIAGATVQSEDPVATVTVKFYELSDIGNTVLVTAELRDDGVYPDTTAGDNKFTGVVFYVFGCRQVGEHSVEFVATSSAGLNSPLIQENIAITRVPNTPPVVSNIVIVPDSLSDSDTTFFIFMITANDPNGQCDVRNVFYTGFAPNNTSLTPRELYDDGSCCVLPPFNTPSGDTTASDTKFTRKLFGSPDQVGYYRYFIKAVDRMGDTSNVLADSIYVYP